VNIRTKARLQAEKDKAATRQKQQETSLRSEGNRPAEPGDLFPSPNPDARDILEWAVVNVHPDDSDLLFIVPSDDNDIFCGVADVRITTVSMFGPMVIRCGYGLWIARRHLNPADRSGLLDKVDMTRVRRTMAGMARGVYVTPTLQQEQDEMQTEYEQQCDLVAREHEKLSMWLESQT
jgi:hypothetical protein